MATFDDDVLLVRRSRLVQGAAFGPLLLGSSLCFAGQAPAAAIGGALAWLGLGAVLYAWSRNPLAGETPARARADARGLFVDERLAVAAERIRGGWVQPRPQAPPSVHICVRGLGRDVELVTRDALQGRALLRALGIDPARVSADYWAMARPLGEPRRYAGAAMLGALVLAFGVVAGQAAPAAVALAVLAMVVLVLGVTAPTRVTVGADGLLLRWLGSARFITWSSVATIERYDGSVVLALEAGRWLTLRAPLDHERYHPERDAMFERLRVAWRAHASRRPDEITARLLRREGGHTREWVRAMRAMAGPFDGYRTGAMPPERLWRVVEDPAADRLARAGAALALAPFLDASGRDRLRVVAQACAEPRLRVALRTAASPAGTRASDEDLAATLDAIESDGEDDSEAARGG